VSFGSVLFACFFHQSQFAMSWMIPCGHASLLRDCTQNFKMEFCKSWLLLLWFWDKYVLHMYIFAVLKKLHKVILFNHMPWHLVSVATDV
jgi:hypothetical protein